MKDDLRDKQSAAHKDKLKVAMDAFNSGCVIHSNDTGKWYTPREFMNCDERVVFTKVDLNENINFTLIYPKHAIKRKLDDLHNAEQELQGFMLKMLNAFELSPISDKNKKK
jgi:hypothetical protein